MKKVVGENDKVPLLLTQEQIDLIVEHTFAEDSLLNSLRISEVVGRKRRAMFTLHDLEYLDGHVAAAANYCEKKELQRELDSIFDTIQKVQAKYGLCY